MTYLAATTLAALTAADLPIPAAVTDAEKFATATAEQRATLAAATPPDLDTATAATAQKLVHAYAEHVTMHPARLAAADRLVTIAESRVEAAWKQAAEAARPKMAEAFDRLAAEFGQALDARPGITADNVTAYHLDPTSAEVFALSTRLDALAAMRDEFAGQQIDRNNGTYSDTFERLTRHLVVLDRHGATRPPSQLHPQHLTSGASHWITAHHSPRYRIAWQELNQQREQVRVITQETNHA